MEMKYLLIFVLLLFILGCNGQESLDCYEIIVVGDFAPEDMKNMEDAKHIALDFLEGQGSPSSYDKLFGIKEDTGGYTIQFKGEPPEVAYEGNILHVMELQLNKGKIFARRKVFC